MTELTRGPERLARARALNKQVIALRDDLHEKWYRFCQVLYPMYSEQLWQELGHKNWTSYIETTLKLPVTTVGNYLQPYSKLLNAGINPEIAADIPLNRVSDIATIAKANDGKIDPKLLEQARTAHTREESRAFKQVVAKEKERLGIEPVKEVKILVGETLYNMWRECVGYVAQIDGLAPEKRHDAVTLEMALVALQDTDEIREVIESC